MPRNPILIMAGGTGGHIYPALSVADYLRRHGSEVVWLGSSGGMESRIVPEHGYRLLTVDVGGVRGKGLLRWCSAPFMLLLALAQAARILLRVRPGAVLGMGGFASGPGGVAAWLLRIPLCIHEQNARAGLTNRLLAPLARAVMQGFPGTFRAGRRVHTTGNPVRGEVAGLAPPAERLRERGAGPLHLLILGGSQGARVLNELTASAWHSLSGRMPLHIWHQTGPRLYQLARAGYGEAAQGVRVDPYIDDMAAAYAWADVVLCRAGASTIAELCMAGLAAILVPYPHAVDDHQTANARHLSDHGCAVLVPEQELSAARLAELLLEFNRVRDRLVEMACRARDLAWPDAARAVGDTCLEMAHG